MCVKDDGRWSKGGVSANRKGRMQSSESGTELKIMQVGQGQGNMVISANRKSRMQSSESRTDLYMQV